MWLVLVHPYQNSLIQHNARRGLLRFYKPFRKVGKKGRAAEE